MHGERGKLLFRVAVKARVELTMLWLLTMATIVLEMYRFYNSHRDWTDLLVIAAFASNLLTRRIAIYDKVIYFPRQWRRRAHFIAWSQIERFWWDDGVLTVVPTEFLVSGAASGGEPIPGGSIRVPEARRAQVENLLSQATASPVERTLGTL